MAGGSRDVDSLWAALKRQTAASAGRRAGPLSGLAGLPGVTSRVRVVDKHAREAAPARPSFISQLGQAPRPDGDAPSDHQALLASLQRDINGLSDPDRSTRRRAVEKLHAALLAPPGVPPDALAAALAGPLLVPLVRLLADQAEKCRELAAAFFAAALPCLPAPNSATQLLPTLVPALAERVGTPPVQEPSEEMRLGLAELVAGPLLGAAAACASSGALPAELLAPLAATVCCQLQDPFADIKKAACSAVPRLAGLAAPEPLPAALLQPLVLALADCLSHQHSRVRLAALQALHALVQAGLPLALMEEAVLPAAQLACLLQQALAELREWTATLRLAAARLLRAALIYGEGEVLPQLPTVMHALRTAVADDDAGVATQAVGCVHVLGVNLPPRHWLPLAAELATAEQQSAAQRTAALVVLSALLYAASRAAVPADDANLQLAVLTLASPQVADAAAATDGGAVRQQVLAACSNLLRWAGPAVAPAAPQLFALLLRLWAADAAAQQAAAAPEQALQPTSSSDSLSAAAVLKQLAAAVGAASAAELCEGYGLALLSAGIQGHEQWTHSQPEWRTLSALLRISSGAALAQLWPAALPALQQIAADHERDPRLRLELLQLLAALLEDDSKAPAWQAPNAAEPLVKGILQPALVWRAGRVPAAVRFAALSAAAAMLAKRRLPAEQLALLAAGGSSEAGSEAGLPSSSSGGLLHSVASCLDEDYEPDTRHLACHTVQLLLEAVGPHLPPAQLAALQPELMRRLDDSSNRVRIAACGALQAWLSSLAVAAASGRSGEGGLADADAFSLASSMLIHLDDGDDEVACAACAVLEQVAVVRPGTVRPLAEAAVAQPAREPLLQRVLAACEQ
ncbi:dynein assembly factor axonemal [Chlorella sorokiniana]|uniref:Dynein assembly factor axonemal n=1 Tax=Chlorella sorokiniana TaxID=3076 RepID=A0A2P6TIY6_CHLSO|nr:dynein assembly factor axonemal [Chlorella sorokiniana]|eukprot:PRW39200.1 dynein assembly factor axonemal [Chlorella sorokiniana]